MDKNISQLSEAFQLLVDKIYSWLDGIVLALPNFLLVIVALFVGLKLIKIARRVVQKLVVKNVPNVGVQNLSLIHS